MDEILNKIIRLTNMRKYFELIISPPHFLRFDSYFIFMKDMIYNNYYIVSFLKLKYYINF